MSFRWIGKSEDGNTITLRKLPDTFPRAEYATAQWLKDNADLVRVGAVVDVETTGLDQTNDKVIEIGIRQFTFNRVTGDILNADIFYTGLQDPGVPLSEEITAITGLTNADLAGKSIDWNQVNQLVAESQVIIAHNASFDRPFIDRHANDSAKKIWGCSLKQVDWSAKGFLIQKLEVLGIYHGFFSNAHRALADATSLLSLLSHTDEKTGITYLKELLENAKRPSARVIAIRAPFDAKDALKSRRYQWDNQNKFWHKTIYKDDLAKELKWHEEAVYFGAFGGTVQEIAAAENFKGFA